MVMSDFTLIIWLLIGGVASTAILSFCFRVVYWHGYRAGGLKVLDEWDKFTKELEEVYHEQRNQK